MNWIEEGSQFADSVQFQGADSAFMHAMSSGTLSPTQSQKKMCTYIKEKMGNFTKYAGQGRYEDAFHELGMALHPIMDSTSPAHRGFQKWQFRNALDHGSNKPSFPSMEDVDTAKRYRDETVELMQQAMHSNSCGCE